MHGPNGDQVVRHIHLFSSPQHTSVYQLKRSDLGRRAAQFVKSYVASNGRHAVYRNARPSVDAMTLVNVVITEPDPVYLVLTSQGKVLWNIHASRRSKIGGIVLVGRRAVGIANVPTGVHIEALVGEQLEDCGVVPARRPEDHWRLVQRARGGAGYLEEVLTKNIDNAERYSLWLAMHLGDADYRLVSQAYRFSNVLVGPLPSSPENRVPFQSIQGADVRMSGGGFFFAATKKGYQERTSKLVKEAAIEAAGGDLERLLDGS